MKALGTGWARGVRWVDIETVETRSASDPLGVTLGVTLHGRTAELAGELGGRRTHLAVSRTRSHAVAVVLLDSEGA